VRLPSQPLQPAGQSRRLRSMPPAALRPSVGTNRSTSEVMRSSSAAANFSFKMGLPMPQNPAKPRIKPPALMPGDSVGIVAPASNIQPAMRSEEHTSELQSQSNLVCRLLLEKKKKKHKKKK